jgi:hypothetical protein
MELRGYQIDIAQRAADRLRQLKIVYISAEVRTGKTLMALETAKLIGAKSVLFLTKKKAIGSIQSDYSKAGYSYNLTVINNESIHLINGQFDLIISDEHHRNGAYPKPNKTTKIIRDKYAHLPMIFLSGTPHPESYSQIYHQFWVSHYSPFSHYKNFYYWARDFVTITEKYLGYAKVNDYSKCNIDKLRPYIDRYFITFTQKQAGFETEVKENILWCDMQPETYAMINELKKNKVIEMEDGEAILADTGVKEMSKLHQMYSGTVKFESGNSMVIDISKALFIREKFTEKIAIFYKFKEEYKMLQQVYGNQITDDLEVFNATDKNIALQIVSGREGISLRNAKYLVYLNMDFSAVSYWQSRDRMTTMERQSNEVFYVFSKGGIERKIYQAVLNKKDFTLSVFKQTYND